MSDKSENNGGFGSFFKILLGIAILVGLFYLYLALTK